MSDLRDLSPPPPISRSNSELSDSNISVSESTSSQASQESQNDRIPSETDLANDKWSYIKEFFVMSQLPTGKYQNCSYKCLLCCKDVRASHTTYDSLKSHMKTRHSSRAAEFLSLIAKGARDKRRREYSPVSSPSSQKMLKDYRGAVWGKPGQPKSNRLMDDYLVDLFVDAMLPIMVSH